MQRNGGLIRNARLRQSYTTTSGIHDLHDQYLHNKIGNWDNRQIVSVTPNTTTINEGASVSFTIVTSGIPDGGTINWGIITISGTTMGADDFSNLGGANPILGQMHHEINSNTCTVTLTTEGGGGTENNTFQFYAQVSYGAEGSRVTSSVITVTDLVGTDLTADWYDMCDNVIIDSSWGDYTGAWDVSEVEIGNSGSYQMIIALKNTSSTTYYNDICIAAVQIVNSSNTNQQIWIMTNSAQSWTRTTSADSGTSGAKPNRTISSADGLTYSNMGSGNNIQYIGWANSTGSSYTGMAAGIATNTTNLTVGNGTMSQSGNNYYWYAEVSGSTRYSCRYMKSPSHTFSSGDKIRICYSVCIPSSMSSTVTGNDSIWLGLA